MKLLQHYLCFLFVIISLIFGSCTIQQDQSQNAYPDHVGDIASDEGLDDPDFKVCNEKGIYQYYNFGKGLQYKGEKPKIEEHFKTFVSEAEKQSGYVTIRFVVNCTGATGRFRIQQMDTNYQEATFLPETIDQLLTLTKRLDGWVIGDYNGMVRDYYQYLTFKIQEGQLTEILP